MKEFKYMFSLLTSGVFFILSILILIDQIEINERIMFGMIFLCLSVLVLKGSEYDE